jgi:pimeloyl-ACP methyl ester carboxylesterase
MRLRLLTFPALKPYLISLFSILFAVVARAEEYSASEIELYSEDSYRIAGVSYSLPDQNGPALLLLHMAGGDHADWESFLPILKKAGIKSILAVDLRGHGGSDIRKSVGGKIDSADNVNWRDFTQDDFKELVGDFDVAWDFLKKSPSTDTTRMGVMGASIGANYAAIFASENPDVKSIALISPGVVYRGVECPAAIKRYGARPVLLMASEEDEYSAKSCTMLKEISSGTPAHLEILKGSSHGTHLIENNPGFRHFLSDWFKSTL